MNTVDVMFTVDGAQEYQYLINSFVCEHRVSEWEVQLFIGHVRVEEWRETIPKKRDTMFSCRIEY